MPGVSVIVPTFNRAGSLRESLRSILDERDVDLEVVVVDDGSSDDTAAVAAACGPRVRVVSQDHAGSAAARNRGIEVSTKPLVAFQDSDGVALPGRLSVPAAYLAAHPEIDVVIGNGRVLPPAAAGAPEEGEPWVRPGVAAALDGRRIGVAEVFRWNLGRLPAMLFTRRSLEEVGPLDSSFRFLDDLDLVLRVTARFQAVFIDRPLFVCRAHAVGANAERAVVREESVRLAEKLLILHPEVLDAVGRTTFRRRQARRYARLAAARERAGDLEGARLALMRARELDPMNVRYRARALWLAFGRRT